MATNVIELSIIVPMYNETKRIEHTLEAMHAFLNKISYAYEVILVDDGSTDKTDQVVAHKIKNWSAFTLIKNRHSGKAHAVTTGVTQAQGRYILFMDADLSVPLEEIERFKDEIIDEGASVVIASREGLSAQRVGQPDGRHYLGKGFNYLVRLLVLPGILDTQCGFKLFRNDAAKDIFENLKVYNPRVIQNLRKPYTGIFDVEVLCIARARGHKINELPITWTHHDTTNVNPGQDLFPVLSDLFKITLNKWSERYK